MARGGQRQRNKSGAANGVAKPAAKPSQGPAGGQAQKVLAKRLTGKVQEWKGAFGWIVPSQPIQHAAASKNRGRVYMGAEDVEEDISGVGATVSFFLWCDPKGLAAKHIRPAGAAQNGKGSGKGGQAPAPRGSASAKATPQNGAAAAEDRQRVGKKRLTGKVAELKDTHGFITPAEKVEGARKGGKIYFKQADVDLEIAGVGSTVDFFLYKDKTGLGAMHVRPAKQDGKKIEPKKLVKQKTKQEAQNGKKKEKKENKPAAAPDKSTRTSLSSDSMAGTVVVSRNDTIAFIRPDVDIDHDKFRERVNKQLYLHKDDVEDGEFPKVGASILFFVYEDAKGIGAEKCQVLEQGDGTLPEHLKEEMEQMKKEGKKNQKAKSKEAKKASEVVKSGTFAKKQAEKKKQDKKKKNKGGGGEQKEKKEKGPSGPDLPRERVSATMITGEVLNMGRTFGWVKPSEPVAHEMAEKHGGKIYLHKKDITEGTTVEKGSTVSFYVYADVSGLGAEECS
eukprot:TRINITY_DN1820_c0_g1_i3.p1 TRINITY_DN1820_c0_g1~~TRINITY_DN1820_c0_g1_i3.p1  ORF type:complete len:506 (-),score=217.69 TRINITY_DN1820_c0_g1_i3:117-1634(-)